MGRKQTRIEWEEQLPDGLTDREAEVFKLIVLEGLTHQEISERLPITGRTVRFHTAKLLKVTGQPSKEKMIAGFWRNVLGLRSPRKPKKTPLPTLQGMVLRLNSRDGNIPTIAKDLECTTADLRKHMKGLGLDPKDHRSPSVQELRKSLKKYAGNLSAVARDLGQPRHRLERRVKTLSLNLADFRNGETEAPRAKKKKKKAAKRKKR